MSLNENNQTNFGSTVQYISQFNYNFHFFEALIKFIPAPYPPNYKTLM